MKILMVASECAPFAKVGGLADVVPALARALAAQGHTVRLCLPFYDSGRSFPPLSDAGERTIALDLPLPPARRILVRLRAAPGTTGGTHAREAGGESPAIELALIDEPPLFERPGIYGDPGSSQGYSDNGERFMVFSAAAAAVAAKGLDGFTPDIVHCHDHQTGLVAAFLRHGPRGLRADRPIPVVYTIHNLAYQGISGADLFPRTGMDPSLMRPLGAAEYHGAMNFMKAGIALADRLTTVSPTYAEEICTQEFGEGLDGLLRERRGALTGILNGIDEEVWNPETDPLLVARYSAGNLLGKTKNRTALLKEFSVDAGEVATPVIGVVSRLVAQKGFDLLLAGIDRIMEQDLRMVILGTGEESLRAGLVRASERHPDKLGLRIGFDERLAHLIEAGSTMFLMPSRYEPCGLNQMYSLRYGTLPIVRATGGLADTVVDLDEDPARANGFVFRLPEPIELVKTVRRALRAFADRKTWREMVERGMETDFSWRGSAGRYVEVYRAAVASGQRAA